MYKIYFKQIAIGTISGFSGGLLVIFYVKNFFINWTAVACLISVGALIVTTIENRKRFKKDFEFKIRMEEANKIIELASDFIAKYEKCQAVTIDILLKLSTFDKTNENNAKELIIERNEIILNLWALKSNFELLKIRLADKMITTSIFELINKVSDQINSFYKENDREINKRSSEVSEKEIYNIVENHGNIENENVKKNIEDIQLNADKLFKELTCLY